jgi:diguanylate cyclase (GGDEF)-like protein
MNFKYSSLWRSLGWRLCAGGLCWSLIALLDTLWGAGVNFPVLYLFPVVFLVWYGSIWEGLGLLSTSILLTLLLDAHRGEFQTSAFPTLFNELLNIVVMLLAVGAIIQIKRRLQQEKHTSKVDHLTGLLNRRAFCESIKREANRCRREGKPLTVAFLDCDNFKQMNDRHGHKAGDKILRVVAHTLRNNLRAWDLTARLGGDEFVMVLPATSENLAHTVLERTRRDLLRAMEAKGWDVTFSVGAVTYLEMAPVEKMLDNADALMYEVKNTSKNRLKHEVME